MLVWFKVWKPCAIISTGTTLSSRTDRLRGQNFWLVFDLICSRHCFRVFWPRYLTPRTYFILCVFVLSSHFTLNMAGNRHFQAKLDNLRTRIFSQKYTPIRNRSSNDTSSTWNSYRHGLRLGPIDSYIVHLHTAECPKWMIENYVL